MTLHVGFSEVELSSAVNVVFSPKSSEASKKRGKQGTLTLTFSSPDCKCRVVLVVRGHY
jgi:hypothetical protein